MKAFLLMTGVIAALSIGTLQSWVPLVGGPSHHPSAGPPAGPRRRAWTRGPDGVSWPGSARLAAPHEFPFVASLQNARGEKFVGALVSNNTVLTVASKVQGALPVRVRLGNGRLDAADVLELQTADVVVHEDFRSGSFNHDIALLRLPRAVLDEHIQAVRLPSVVERRFGERLFNGQPAQALGWGGAGDPLRLRSVDVAVLPSSNCSALRGADVGQIFLCTRPDPQYKDGPCQSEVGSPLALLELDDEQTAIGLLLDSACPVSAPPLLLRLTEYVAWVAEHGGPRVAFC